MNKGLVRITAKHAIEEGYVQDTHTPKTKQKTGFVF